MFSSWRQCIPSQSRIFTLVSEKSQFLRAVFVVLFCRRHLRVLDAAFACIVPPRQLLVEEAAEDVSALGYSGRSFVQEVPAFINTKKNQNWFPFSQVGCLFTGFSLNRGHSLEVKINDNVIEELAAVEALQVLHGHSYPSFQRRRRELD